MTREQERASKAFEDVSAVSKLDKPDRKRYATVIYQTLVLVRTAGLVQALEFVAGLSNKAKREAGERLLDSLAAQVRGRGFNDSTDAGSLRRVARSIGMQRYMLLTREIVATLVWYRRFVQSVLKIDAAAAMDDRDED